MTDLPLRNAILIAALSARSTDDNPEADILEAVSVWADWLAEQDHPLAQVVADGLTLARGHGGNVGIRCGYESRYVGPELRFYGDREEDVIAVDIGDEHIANPTT